MWMLVNAVKGKVAVFDRKTYGCWGGGVGLGFGNIYMDFPGGIECFYYFISIGNKHGIQVRLLPKILNPMPQKSFLMSFLRVR